MRAQIYTDACSYPGNPGECGGIGIVIIRPGKDIEEKSIPIRKRCTNQIAELIAGLEALKLLHRGEKAVIKSDSQYLVKGVREWLPGWKKRGWKNANRKPVKNRELWEEIDRLNILHNPQWQWIPGHAGIIYNEQADSLATNAAKKAYAHTKR